MERELKLETLEDRNEGEPPKRDRRNRTRATMMDIAMINAETFYWNAKQEETKVFAIWLKDITDHQAKTWKPKTDPLQVLPEEYSDFADVFSKAASNALPEHRPYDHEIRLKEPE